MKLKTDGIEAIGEEFSKRGASMQAVALKCVKEGGNVVAEKLNQSAAGKFKTGTLGFSNKVMNISASSDCVSAEVYPKGKSQSGARQATVGFVQEYGRRYGKKSRAGTGWFNEGVTAAEGPATEAMERIWREAEGADK